MVGYVDCRRGWMFCDEVSKTVFPSAIDQFQYKKDTSLSQPTNLKTSSESINKLLDTDTQKKGSIEHTINALKLGNFTEEINIGKQNAAVSHTLSGKD